ncbi:gliding motility-associated C-terminal domain-containing protein [Olleya namhaensis]|uniref:HYR-like domain-containing protein n=1 Tax=Olleya namhaensis TaxID=1144750 RepID=UPI00249366C2|nr:gliding motility-associated C-terminal domain-containing protein [Olleya namhaensis]
MFSQTIVCEGSPCTSNDFTIETFYLGDINGNPFGPGYCEPGTVVNAYLWVDFTANTAANRYDLFLHFNLYVDGVFIETIDECYYDDQPIPTNVSLNTYNFNWECGAEIELQNLYMGWQTNNNGTCECSRSHCFSDPSLVVLAPLIANFSFQPSCDTAYTINFQSTTSGGLPPYTYLWSFGDGTTSTLANPTHTFASDGPYDISLTVNDQENTDSYTVEILEFDSNVFPEITAPLNEDLIGCTTAEITPFVFSTSSVQILESELITMGGSLIIGNDIVSLSYIDTVSGTCPVTVTRVFTLTDSCNHTVTASQLIIINDTINPTASNPAAITVACIGDVPASDINVVISEADNCSIPTVQFVSDVSNGLTCPETITRTYSVTDACNNSITVTQDIVVHDTIVPTASNPVAINVTCIGDVPTPNVNVVTDEADNCSAPIVQFVSDVSDGLTCPETITRTYSVTDACNNSITVTQDIIINDTIAPTASNPITISVTCVGDVPTANENVVTDEADNCSTPIVQFVSDVSDGLTCPETITRTYSVTDACNNSITVTQDIIINDTVAPTASNPIAISVICIDDVPVADINVVTDEADNCSTPTVQFVSDVSDGLTCPETITRTYSITDACNNSITVTQDIIINDTVAPTASNPITISVTCIDDVPVADSNVVTDEADNCSTPIVQFVSDVSDGLTCPETITRTYSVTDACNNSITVTQDIIINDTIAPTASNPIIISVTCVDDVPTPDTTVVSDEADNCSTPTVQFVSDVSDGLTCPETITRTYSVTDACNNSITVTQDIIINDTVAPTASNPIAINVTCVGYVPTANINVVTDEADNCSTPIVQFVRDVSDGLTCPETITRTYSITDACNNSITVTQDIIINDTIAPTASNPIAISVTCVDDVPTANINVVTDEADNCSTPIVQFVSDVFDGLTCPETITRTYSVTDACNNSITVTQDIIINDTIAPTASNPVDLSVICVGDVPTPDTTVVSDEADNCSTPIVQFVSDVSDGLTCPETITRTYSVTDACNNSITVTQNIIINDTITPTASNPIAISVTCVDDVPTPDTTVVSDEADNCSTPIVQFVSDVSDGLTCPETITRTYSVTDACNNSITVTQDIIINDTVAPTASNPVGLSVICVDDVPTPNINVVIDATDNCSAPTVQFVSDVSDGLTCPETITRTYSVTDACNNSITVIQNIIINDTIAPTASDLVDVFLLCDDNIPSFNVQDVSDASDNCSLPEVFFVSDISNGSCPETIVRTYKVVDDCDNFTLVTQNFIVEDNIAPILLSPLDEVLTVSCTDIPAVPSLQFEDNCSQNVLVSFNETSTNTDNTQDYVIVREWTVSDQCLNESVFTQTINVLIADCIVISCNSCGTEADTILPTGSNPADLNVNCGSDIPEPNPEVVIDEADNCAPPVVSFISEVVSFDCLEKIIRTYRITDECGNFIDVTHRINVVDNVLPTASNPADLVLNCSDPIPAPNGSVVTDASDNCSTPIVTFISDISNFTCEGLITRTYRVTDGCGNFIDVVQIINIIDNQPPTASNPLAISITCVDDVPTPNVNVVIDEADNCSLPTVQFVSDVSDGLTCPETITRTYQVTDACNNSIMVTQDIIINDIIAPTASNPSSITVTCVDDVPDPNPNVVTNAADNCSTPVVQFVSDVSDGVSCPMTITRTYSVTDACNNSITVTQDIIINDTIAPTASNPVAINVTCESDIPQPDTNVVTDEADNCSLPTVQFVSDVSNGLTCPVIITRTYSITDACNNSITVTQDIIINDTVAPTASNPITISVTCIDDVPVADSNVVTDEADNCSTPTVQFVSDVSDGLTCPETITRTYSVTDACNNSITVTQDIIINDTIAPTASNPIAISVTCVDDVPSANINVVTDEADNCSTPMVQFVSDVSDGLTCPETITRTYSVTDACNNSITVTQNIIINDTITPTASNPIAISVTCVDDVPTANVNVVTDEADNCSTPIVQFVSDVSDGLTCPETITRTYSVTDACNNSITVTQDIIINDTIAPTASNPIAISVTCVDDVPTANINVVTDEADNCSTPIVQFVSDVSDGLTCPETITRTYSVTDACNNSVTVTQDIIINDTVAPTASNPIAISVTCVDDVPTANINVVTDEADNCSTPIVQFVSDVSDGLTCPETITRTYSVTDACSNSITVTQDIIINDTVAPTASNPIAISVTCVDDVPTANVNVVTDEVDNCSTPTVQFVSDVSDGLTCPETITRTYSIIDACNNSITVTQDIIINDTIAPTASNPDTIMVTCVDDVPTSNTTVVTDASDNCSTPTIQFVSDVSDGLTCPETITRTYSVTDACNNSITVTQDIVINDTIAPTASSPLAVTVSCIGDVPTPNINAITDEADNCSTPIVQFVSDSSDGRTCPETITRTYSVTDACNNSILVTQDIIVNDTTAPTASSPLAITVTCIGDVPTPDINVITDEADNCSVPTVQFISDVSDGRTCPETITRTFSVTDACNNSIMVTQDIIINDTVAPVLISNIITEQFIACGEIPEIPNIIFEDNCTQDLEINFTESINNIDAFNYDIIRDWEAIDDCGNNSGLTQVIHVNTIEDVERRVVNLCIEDESVDLRNYITNTTFQDGLWTSEDIANWEGYTFTPSDMEIGGSYVINYLYTVNGCSWSTTILIEINDDCVYYPCVKSENDVSVTKMVTPNGDNDHDFLEINYVLNEQSNEVCEIEIDLEIFNRWGAKVYKNENYNNEWNGASPSSALGASKTLPTGTYYYIIELKNSGLKPIQGYILLGAD